MNGPTTTQKVKQINELRVQARNWRIGTTVAVFAITACCLALLYNSATKLGRAGAERDQFVTEFKEGLTTEVGPQAKQIALRTWHDLVPQVQTEVVKLQSRYPEMADAIEFELDRLTVNLPARAEKVLHSTVGEVIQQREQTIRKLYGEITPEQVERIKTIFLTEAQRRAGSLAEVLVTPFEGTVQGIRDDLRAIEASAGDVTPEQASEQLTALLVKLTEIHLQTAATEFSRLAKEQTQLAEVR